MTLSGPFTARTIAAVPAPCLEAVHLAAKGITADVDIHEAQGWAIESLCVFREHDGACARAHGRHALSDPLRQWLPQAEPIQQTGDRRTLTARQDQAINTNKIGRGAHLLMSNP